MSPCEYLLSAVGIAKYEFLSLWILVCSLLFVLLKYFLSLSAVGIAKQ